MRVVIAEDQALLREGLALMLDAAGYDVVAAVPDQPALMHVVELEKPGLVVTDIRMPPSFQDEGLVAALRIRREHPQTAVLVLSQYVHKRYALELITSSTGGVGYLLKQRVSDIKTFRADVATICRGGVVLDPEVVDRLMDTAHVTELDEMTERQRDVFAQMAAGRSNAAIARNLFISEKAVVKHVSHIYDLLVIPPSADEHRRVMAVVRYLAGV